MNKIDFFGQKMFFELDLSNDTELVRAANACIVLHQTEQSQDLTQFRPDASALEKVSEEELKKILNSQNTVHGITTSPEISNCLTFNLDSVKDSLTKESIRLSRNALDQIVRARLEKLFKVNYELSITNSGHFLYPPGGFMSWHTNLKSPGWRLYINYAEEPEKSFLRYQDPDSGQIVTSWDKKWNFRLFKIDPKKLFWHAVYSNTNRYSFGYRITIDWNQPLYKRVLFRTKNLFSLALGGSK